ncbi:MAG: hypothetical protein HW421_267 [Ignavibacteria bacterium]|nr:hypothetical protein [Ignavibacteria bacterium]
MVKKVKISRYILFPYIIILLCLGFINLLAENRFDVINLMKPIGSSKPPLKQNHGKVYFSDGTILDNKRYSVADTSRNSADSLKRENKIVSVVDNGEFFNVRIELANYENDIKINIFNMLGKNVMEVFKGIPTKEIDYTFSISNLPNGIYFLKLQGRNFTRTRKFIVSR